MNPYDAAHSLAKALRESPEFKEYAGAQDLLAEDSSAREMLLDFRKEQFRLQRQKLSGLEVAPEQLEKYSFEFTNLNLTETLIICLAGSSRCSKNNQRGQRYFEF